MKDMIEVQDKVQDKISWYRNQGRNKEANALERQYSDAYDQWIEHIKMAKADDPDFYLSDFIEI